MLGGAQKPEGHSILLYEENQVIIDLHRFPSLLFLNASFDTIFFQQNILVYRLYMIDAVKRDNN